MYDCGAPYQNMGLKMTLIIEEAEKNQSNDDSQCHSEMTIGTSAVDLSKLHKTQEKSDLRRHKHNRAELN